MSGGGWGVGGSFKGTPTEDDFCWTAFAALRLDVGCDRSWDERLLAGKFVGMV